MTVDTAAQVLAVVGRLRARGFTVVLVPGWETRGRGLMTTRGRVEHHTAGPRSGDTPTLRVVTFGRAGLRNSLSRWYVSRSGVIYLVALNTSWHAGAGVKGTNGTLSGTEAEHTGSRSEPWTAGSLAAQAAISECEALEFGFPPTRVWEHREHAPRRKIDRTGIDGPAWRRRLIRGGSRPPIEEDDVYVIRNGDNGPRVTRAQVVLQAAGTRAGEGNLLPEFGPDGDYGAETAAAIDTMAARAKLPADGNVGMDVLVLDYCRNWLS